MDFMKTLFGVIAIVGTLSIPAAMVYMMAGIGAEAFSKAEELRANGSCPPIPANLEHTGVVGRAAR